MADKTIEQYKTWFEYEKDSHAKTINSLLAIPAEKRHIKEFQKAVDLFCTHNRRQNFVALQVRLLK